MPLMDSLPAREFGAHHEFVALDFDQAARLQRRELLLSELLREHLHLCLFHRGATLRQRAGSLNMGLLGEPGLHQRAGQLSRCR